MSEVTKENNDSENKENIVVSFLKQFGYIVEDTSGKTHFLYNVLEFIVQVVYFFLSFYNAIRLFSSSDPISVMVWTINILVLAKIWTKNMKEAHKLAIAKPNIRELESFCGVVRVQSMVYKRKTLFINLMLGISIFSIIYSFIFGYTSTFDPKGIVGIIVVVTSFIDGGLSILESMYQAIPKNTNILTIMDER